MKTTTNLAGKLATKTLADARRRARRAGISFGKFTRESSSPDGDTYYARGRGEDYIILNTWYRDWSGGKLVQAGVFAWWYTLAGPIGRAITERETGSVDTGQRGR